MLKDNDPRNCHERVFLATGAMVVRRDDAAGLRCAILEHLSPLMDDDFPTADLRTIFRGLMGRIQPEDWGNELTGEDTEWLKKEIWHLCHAVINHMVYGE